MRVCALQAVLNLASPQVPGPRVQSTARSGRLFMRTRARRGASAGSGRPASRSGLSRVAACATTSTRRVLCPRAAPSARSSTASSATGSAGRRCTRTSRAPRTAGICHRRPTAPGRPRSTRRCSRRSSTAQPDLSGKPVPPRPAAGRPRLRAWRASRRSRSTARISSPPSTRRSRTCKIPVKDVKNPDPTKSCNAPAAAARARCTTTLTDLLGRFQDLYNDGTIPQSTESLARVDQRVQGGDRCAGGWARFDARPGYRPIDLALGAARPIIAYPGLRDFVERDPRPAVGRLAARTQLNPKLDASGNRIPVPGAGEPAAHEAAERRATPSSSTRPPTRPSRRSRAPPTRRRAPRCSRARAHDLEFTPVASSTRRIRRSAAATRATSSSATRAATRRCRSCGGKHPRALRRRGRRRARRRGRARAVRHDRPASRPRRPFFAVGAADARARDTFSRALDAAGGQLPLRLHRHEPHVRVDACCTTSSRSSNPNPAEKHETLMDVARRRATCSSARATARHDDEDVRRRRDGHLQLVPHDELADRSICSTRSARSSPIRRRTTTLSFASTLVSQHPNDVARLVGDGLYRRRWPTRTRGAHPGDLDVWDEIIDVAIQIDQEPGLLEDVLRALGDDASLPLSTSFSGYMANTRPHLVRPRQPQRPGVQLDTNDTSPPKTAVDRSQPDTGCEPQRDAALPPGHPRHQRRHGLQQAGRRRARPQRGDPHHRQPEHRHPVRLRQQRPHRGAALDQLRQQADVQRVRGLQDREPRGLLPRLDHRQASLYFRDNIIRNGSIGGLGAATVGLIENSSGIGYDPNSADHYNGADLSTPGFWDTANSQTFRPKPGWLDRLVFFDLANDSPTSAGKNYNTNHFLTDLQGTQIGSSICPERVIPDPCAAGGSATCSGAPDVASDRQVHGLRKCADGDWLFQRDQDAIIVWEDSASTTRSRRSCRPSRSPRTPRRAAAPPGGPLHRADGGAPQALADRQGPRPSECTLQAEPGRRTAPRTARTPTSRSWPQIFSSDMLTALHDLVKILEGITVPTCAAVDPTTHSAPRRGRRRTASRCSPTPRARSSIPPARRPRAQGPRGEASRRSATTGRRTPRSRRSTSSSRRSSEIDAAFAAYAQANPNDAERQAQWQSARSQLVDQFLSVNGQNTPTQTFADPSLPADHAGARRPRCARSSGRALPGPPYGHVHLGAHSSSRTNASATIGGPTFAAAMDLIDAIRQNQAGRTASSSSCSPTWSTRRRTTTRSAELMASTDDIIQVLRDDTNLVPLYHVLAVGDGPHHDGRERQRAARRGRRDHRAPRAHRRGARTTRTATRSARASSIPTRVLDVALAHLVTPMTGSNGQRDGDAARGHHRRHRRREPRRARHDRPSSQATDYANMANELSEFLLDKQRGLEQFYADREERDRALMARKTIAAAVAVLAGTLATAGDAGAAGLYFSDRGVRPLGRGGAFVAGADDLGAIWYNPAGIADARLEHPARRSWLHYTSDFTRQALTTSATGTSFVQTFPTVSGSTPRPADPDHRGVVPLRRPRAVRHRRGGIYAPMTPVTSYPRHHQHPTARRPLARSATRSSRSTARRSS